MNWVTIWGDFEYKGMTFTNIFVIPSFSMSWKQDVLAWSISYYFNRVTAEENIANNLDIMFDPESSIPTDFNVAYDRDTDWIDILKISLTEIKAKLDHEWYVDVVSDLG